MKRLGASLLALSGATSVVIACGGSTKPPPAAPAVVISTKCPDLSKADEVGAFDFAKEYHLSREAADKLKAAALASMEVNLLNDKLEGDLGIACAGIAHDLGNKSEGHGGYEMCGIAFKAVHDARGKLSAKAQAQLVVRQPLCLVDASLMTKCASICDSSVPASRVKADCQQTVGRCDGQCDGACELKTAAKCDGSCSGQCDGTMKGPCAGKCRGTCDGKNSSGVCGGVCVGTCIGGATAGECKGTCNGTCKPKTAGICDGLCAGKCSVEVAEPKCAGEFKTPDVSTDCRARCELAVINQTECSKPASGLVITGATGKDRETADQMKTALDKAFPDLLKILFEVGEKGPKRVANAKDVIEGARTGFKEMATSGGKESAAASQAQLEKCFDEPFKKAITNATAVKGGLDQAIGVRDEASK